MNLDERRKKLAELLWSQHAGADRIVARQALEPVSVSFLEYADTLEVAETVWQSHYYPSSIGGSSANVSLMCLLDMFRRFSVLAL